MSIGGRASEGFSSGSNFGSDLSGNIGQSFQRQDIYAPQAPWLEQGYNMAGGAAQDAQTGVNDFLQSNPYLGYSGDAVGRLAGMGDPQALIDAQTGSLQAGLRELFGEGSSAIDANAASAGAFGGSRHGMQEAALGGEIADAFTKGYGDIVANARNQAIQANTGAIAGANDAFGLGLQGELARFAPAQAFLQSLGSPIVLGEGGSYDFGSSSGINTGRQEAADQSGGFGIGIK